MKLTLTDDAGNVVWQMDIPCPVPMYPQPWWGIYPPQYYYYGQPVTYCTGTDAGNGANSTLNTHNAPHMAGVTLT